MTTAQTLPDRERNRLTALDRETMSAAMLTALDGGIADSDALARIAFRSIGCTAADLRDCEIGYVVGVARRLVQS